MPPPVAKHPRAAAGLDAIGQRPDASMSRNAASPLAAKKSRIGMPIRDSISVSVSCTDQP